MISVLNLVVFSPPPVSDIHVFLNYPQISRLLVVDPAARLTAEQALAHSFFRLYQKEDIRLFSPRKTFRVGWQEKNLNTERML